MSERLDSKTYVNIMTKGVRAEVLPPHVCSTLWFLEADLIGRGQWIELNSPADARSLYLEDETIDFIENFFSFRDKDNNTPQSLFLASSISSETTAALYSGELPATPAGFPDGTGLVGKLVLSLDGKDYEVAVGIDPKKQWTENVAEIQQEFKTTLASTIFKDLKITWLADTRRLYFDAGIPGAHTIKPAAKLDNNDINNVLKVNSESTIVIGGAKTSFSANILDVLEKLKDRVSMVAWDQCFDTPEAAELPKIMANIYRENMFKVVLFSSNKLNQANEVVEKYPLVAFCYDKSDTDDGVYVRPKTAFLISQIAACVRFDDNHQITDFNRYFTSLPGDIKDKAERKAAEAIKANFIEDVRLSILETNILNGGNLWGGPNDLQQLRTAISEQWLRNGIEKTLLNFMMSAQVITTNPYDLAKVETLITNIASVAVKRGIFSPVTNMAEETKKTIPKNIMQSLVSQNYYLSVVADVETEVAPGGKTIVRNVIRYSLYYFAGNNVNKITGNHVIYN